MTVTPTQVKTNDSKMYSRNLKALEEYIDLKLMQGVTEISVMGYAAASESSWSIIVKKPSSRGWSEYMRELIGLLEPEYIKAGWIIKYSTQLTSGVKEDIYKFEPAPERKKEV